MRVQLTVEGHKEAARIGSHIAALDADAPVLDLHSGAEHSVDDLLAAMQRDAGLRQVILGRRG